MSKLPRIMIVVWRWGNSDQFRLPEGHTHVEWLLDAPTHAGDRFVQVDLRAREALNPITGLVYRFLATSNVLLFLHDHQDYGFSSEFRRHLVDSIANAGGNRIGQLYVRLFTGGKEPVYCTPQFLRGILGSGGNFASDLVGLPDRIPVVIKFDPGKEERVLNAEHFNAVWQHYWQHSRQSEKLGYLKENFARWARKYDDDLYKNASGYPYYLQKDPDLWKALASFVQNQDVLYEISESGETPNGLQDFSEFRDYMELVFPPKGDGQPSKHVRAYHQLREDMLIWIYYKPVENAERLTEDIYNRMDDLYHALPGENF